MASLSSGLPFAEQRVLRSKVRPYALRGTTFARLFGILVTLLS
jgi:hypothetical protein